MKFSPSSSTSSSPKHLKVLSCLNLIDLIEHFGGFSNATVFLGSNGFGSFIIAEEKSSNESFPVDWFISSF